MKLEVPIWQFAVSVLAGTVLSFGVVSFLAGFNFDFTTGGSDSTEYTSVQPVSSEAQWAELRATLDAISHPNDPSLPVGIRGTTDAELGMMPQGTAEMLLENAESISAIDNDGRLLFNTARAAFASGYYEDGEALLEVAAERGSAPAKAMMAEYYLSEGELEEAESLAKASAQSGFPEASDVMKQIEQAYASRKVDPNEFIHGSIISSFLNGTTSDLNRAHEQRIMALFYLKGFGQILQAGDPIFMQSPEMQKLQATAPSLSTRASRALEHPDNKKLLVVRQMGNSINAILKGVNRGMSTYQSTAGGSNDGMQMLLGGFMGLVDFSMHTEYEQKALIDAHSRMVEDGMIDARKLMMDALQFSKQEDAEKILGNMRVFASQWNG